MKTLTKKTLTSQRLKGYAERRNIDLYLNQNDESGEYELRLSFVEVKDGQTEDDVLIYDFKEGTNNDGLFFASNYQVEGLEDLPRWINNEDQLKELINYMSKEGK